MSIFLNAKWFLHYCIHTCTLRENIYISTNLHNSIEEAGVTKVIDAFDRDQGAVDDWTFASGRVRVIWRFLSQLNDLGWCCWNTENKTGE